MLETLFTGFIGGACAWLLTDFVAKPYRRFFDLRREICRCLVVYGNVSAREKMDGDVRARIAIPSAEDDRLTEAQKVFRNLAGEMRAFANAEILANWFVKQRGYDADEIASSLIGYSNEVATYGESRNYYRDRAEKLLRIRSAKK